MKIFYKVNRVMSDGEIVIVGLIYKGDVPPASQELQENGALAGHGETVYCETAHTHGKSCAAALLDSVRPAMESYFTAWDATPEDAVPADMPKKSLKVTEDGKTKTVQVDDLDLAALDLPVPQAGKGASSQATEQ